MTCEAPEVAVDGKASKPVQKPRAVRIPAEIPRVEIIHDLPDSQKICPRDGTPLKRIDSEIHEQLDIIPAQVQADASSNLYSLIETAKANGLEPRVYLTQVFSQLPNAQTLSDIEALLPWAGKDGVR